MKGELHPTKKRLRGRSFSLVDDSVALVDAAGLGDDVFAPGLQFKWLNKRAQHASYC